MVKVDLIPSQKARSLSTEGESESRAGYLANHQNFFFRFEKRHERKVQQQTVHYWKCSFPNCKTRLITDENDEVLEERKEHIHSPQEKEVVKRKCVSKIRKRAAETMEKISKIVTNELGDFPTHVQMPATNNLKRMSERCRTVRNLPPIPTSTITFNVPVDLQNYKEGSFYRGKCGQGEKHIVFASDQGLELLQEHENLYGDGTFKVSPTLFYQLYVVHIEWFNLKKTIPVVFVLMSGKSKQDYTDVFEYLKGLCPKLNPVTYTSDFESACIKAFEEVFPLTHTRTCFFHLSQSFRRHADRHGLMQDLKCDASLNFDFHLLRAIAFIPCQDVIDVWEVLVPTIDSRLSPIIEWFEKIYIGKLTHNGRSWPVFAINTWNVFDRTKNGENRTNNGVEGANYGLKAFFECIHPSPWKFVEELRSYQIKIDVEIREFREKGLKMSSRRTNQEYQQELCKRYHLFNPMDFLYEMAKLL